MEHPHKRRITVNKLMPLLLIVLATCALTACATPDAEPVASKPINPGDRVGDFLITTGGTQGICYVCTQHCPFDESTATESCEFSVGAKVNIGVGFYDDPNTQETLDETWAREASKTAITIEGRPVNLEAFGFIDIPNALLGTIRNWNVVIIGEKPGKISAHSTGEYAGNRIDQTAALTFVAP